jgi:hypothetical protein
LRSVWLSRGRRYPRNGPLGVVVRRHYGGRVTDAEPQWIEHFSDLSLEEALDLAASQGRLVRVLRPGDAMTMDFQPDRVNLLLDNDGHLSEVTRG